MGIDVQLQPFCDEKAPRKHAVGQQINRLHLFESVPWSDTVLASVAKYLWSVRFLQTLVQHLNCQLRLKFIRENVSSQCGEVGHERSGRVVDFVGGLSDQPRSQSKSRRRGSRAAYTRGTKTAGSDHPCLVFPTSVPPSHSNSPTRSDRDRKPDHGITSLTGRHWDFFAESRSEVAHALQQQHQLHPLVAHCLSQSAGRHAPKDWLNPSWNQLHSPDLMHGLPKAVERIRRAIHDGESIRIVTDYDVDGTTSSLILQHTMRILKASGPLSYHIPNRFDEGYGFSVRAVTKPLRTAFNSSSQQISVFETTKRSIEPKHLAST